MLFGTTKLLPPSGPWRARTRTSRNVRKGPAVRRARQALGRESESDRRVRRDGRGVRPPKKIAGSSEMPLLVVLHDRGSTKDQVLAGRWEDDRGRARDRAARAVGGRYSSVTNPRRAWIGGTIRFSYQQLPALFESPIVDAGRRVHEGPTSSTRTASFNRRGRNWKRRGVRPSRVASPKIYRGGLGTERAECCRRLLDAKSSGGWEARFEARGLDGRRTSEEDAASGHRPSKKLMTTWKRVAAHLGNPRQRHELRAGHEGSEAARQAAPRCIEEVGSVDDRAGIRGAAK